MVLAKDWFLLRIAHKLSSLFVWSSTKYLVPKCIVCIGANYCINMTINEIHAYYALFSAKKHMAGFDMMRMLYFSAYDMEVHIRYVIKLLYQR